jgi:hypothetical protein
LLDLLYGIRFPQKYRALCLQYSGSTKARHKKSPALKLALQEALANTGLTFRYYRNEDFHRYHLAHDVRCDLKFHVSTIGDVGLELAFYVQFPGEHILGGHFAGFTESVLMRCEPGESLDPRPGNLHFEGSREKLAGAVEEGSRLFMEARDAILAETGWIVTQEKT